MKSKRLFEISAMNIVLCLLVVMIHVTSEPVSGYQRSSLPFAVVCILQRSIHFVVQGFIFLSGLKLMKSRSRESYPAFCLDRFRRIVLPYLLWVISNWCFTSLMDGDGSFRDIYCATGVALIPLTIVNFLQIPLSYMVTLSESTIYDFLGAFALVYTYLMLFAGMMTTHQYSVGKSIITTVLTIVGMAMIVFIVLLMIYLVQQMYGFGDSLYSEIAFRLNE